MIYKMKCQILFCVHYSVMSFRLDQLKPSKKLYILKRRNYIFQEGILDDGEKEGSKWLYVNDCTTCKHCFFK